MLTFRAHAAIGFLPCTRLTTNFHATRRNGWGGPCVNQLTATGMWVSMSYLRLRRTQLILASFVICSLLLSAFPAIDIQISRFFFDGVYFHLNGQWQTFFREGLVYFLCASMAFVGGIYALGKMSKRNLCRVNGKTVCYLFLVLILGAGLIVNVTFKDNFGRARPRDIQQFGGSKHFTPAFVVSDQCDTNCSFSSGEGAGAFFSLALAFALRRRRIVLLAAFGLGSLVSLSRIAAGAHFFSDTVVSFFVMLIVTDVLYHYMLSPETEAQEVALSGVIPDMASTK